MSLKIQVRTALAQELEADVTAYGVFAAPADRKALALGPALKTIDAELKGGLQKLVVRDEFTGKKDQILTVQTPAGRTGRIVLFGLGELASLTAGDVRTFAAKATRAAQGEKASSLVIALPAELGPELRAVAEGVELGAYRFSKYLTGDRKPKGELKQVTLVFADKLRPDAKKHVALGQQIGAAINRSRDLGNEPSNVVTPKALADAAAKMAKEHGLKVQVFDFAEIKKRGMTLIQAVGQGSNNEPRFVHIAYTPAKKAKRRLVFVGKGVTFDSGGISIKPAAGMGEMKGDMSGAGNMVGLMAAVAALKPAVEVHAILTCAENMPDGCAYRPGDVWGSLDGKTVEVVNTDAEGRLILADALAYARELSPDILVDNATLTGACVVALGMSCSAFYATTDEVAQEFAAAVKAAGEQMWRMPLLDDLKEQLKSDIADVKQAGDRFGGSITAALFLKEFIGDTKHWVHVDIAGPALAERVLGWSPKGATGHGILTFLALIERA